MNKLKKYFTEKPKGNIWKRTTMYLILLRYVGPLAIFLSLPLLVGLLSPNQTMVFQDAGETLATAFTSVMDKMYTIGSDIAINNPIISKIIVFVISNFVYVIYMGIAYLIIDIIRHLSSWIYIEFFSHKQNETTRVRK